MNFVVYRKATGEILRSGSCPPPLLAGQAVEKGEAVREVIDSIDGSKFYLEGGEFVPRPMLPAFVPSIPANGEEHVIASGLPEGTFASIADGQKTWVEGGVLTLASDAPETVAVAILPPFPWREVIVRVTSA